MSASRYPVPATRVISPSPTPSEQSGKEGYFPPTGTDAAGAEPAELSRSRSRSRSPGMAKKGSRRLDGMTPIPEKPTQSNGHAQPTRRKPDGAKGRKAADGYLKPASSGFGKEYWRALSRSPSPLGLIPIHREWRAFVHKHEIPRKALHVSIGFLTLGLYCNGFQIDQIHPVLLSLLIPIFLIDVIRLNYAPFNRVYIRVCGAFMRESEAHDRYNGVISYLAGVWAVMRFCSKDVAVISVLLLSFCDTAASTFGRMFGKYTPRIRRGKSLAGSLAAFIFGVASALIFYVYFGPWVPAAWNSGAHAFAFDGTLSLPLRLRQILNLTKAEATISGVGALTVLSIWAGLVASSSEAVDIFGLDDNLTIPILCGIGLETFLIASR